MSKTIKTINLLNKRANGEKLPQKIKYLDEYYTLYEEAESIENLYLLDGVRVGWFNHANFRLNTAVEIIEEKEEIDIQELEKIKEMEVFLSVDTRQTLEENLKKIDKHEVNFFFKINEIIRKQNKMVQYLEQLDKNIKEK